MFIEVEKILGTEKSTVIVNPDNILYIDKVHRTLHFKECVILLITEESMQTLLDNLGIYRGEDMYIAEDNTGCTRSYRK